MNGNDFWTGRAPYARLEHDSQHLALVGGVLGRLGEGLFPFRQKAPCRRKECLAGGGQLDPAPIPAQQRKPKLTLEREHRRA